MHVRFTADFPWRQPGFTIDYKAGMTLNVKRACGEEAIEKGVAAKIQPTKRGGDDDGR
jgi:hypothetical protein